jgi:hypothetical protein
MAKKKTPRPSPAVCESTKDHGKHLWWPESWDPSPVGLMFHCRGRDNAEMHEGVKATRRAIKAANKSGPRKKRTRKLNWRL